MGCSECRVGSGVVLCAFVSVVVCVGRVCRYRIWDFGCWREDGSSHAQVLFVVIVVIVTTAVGVHRRAARAVIETYSACHTTEQLPSPTALILKSE